jgi:hypothetical protein
VARWASTLAVTIQLKAPLTLRLRFVDGSDHSMKIRAFLFSFLGMAFLPDHKNKLVERGLLGRSSRASAARSEILQGAVGHATRCGQDGRAPLNTYLG